MEALSPWVCTLCRPLAFPGNAAALGYSRPHEAIKDHCKGVVKRDTLTEGGEQELSFIPEGDVYRLVCNSKLPSAEKFERWVFDEVLPNGGPRPFPLFAAVLRKISPARIHEKGANLIKRIRYTIKSSYRPPRGRRA